MDFVVGALMVSNMKYFRHPPLTLWALICVALGALLVVALNVGQNVDLSPGVPDRRVAVQDVFSLTSRMTDISRVSTAPATSLPEWSQETARLADEAAERRLREGASTGDGLVQALRTMAADARNLATVNVDDRMAISAGVALLQADSDALSSILGGARPEAVIPLPGEDAPIVSPDPEIPSDVPAVPSDFPGDVPTVPAVPVNPAQPGNPQIPVIPVPGAAVVPGSPESTGGTR